MKGSWKAMKDIKNEFNKLSKQGKINTYYYLILSFLSLILVSMCLSLISLAHTVKTQEKEIEKLQVKTIIIEQKDLFKNYGG